MELTSSDFFLRYQYKVSYSALVIVGPTVMNSLILRQILLENSKYKSDQLIRKQAYVSKTVIDEMKRIVIESGILDCKDTQWPKPDKIGKQELVIRVGEKEVTLQTSKIGSYAEVQKNKDSEGLTVFFYLVQDLKCFVFSLVNLHFRIKPI